MGKLVGPGGGTHDVEFDGLDGGQVDDLEFLGLGEAVGGEVFREALDTLGGLHTSRLIVGSEVLDGLYVGYIRKALALITRYETHLDLNRTQVL
jgi:hypothetical protein